MAKDAKGHGSSARGTLSRLGIAPGEDYHKLGSAKVQGLVDAAKKAGYRKPANANGSTGRYFHDSLQRQAARETPASNSDAAAQLASGPKSAPAPVHEAMGKYAPNHRDSNAFQHDYHPESVNKAIENSGRFGGGKIGGREARMIHSILKGRGR